MDYPRSSSSDWTAFFEPFFTGSLSPFDLTLSFHHAFDFQVPRFRVYLSRFQCGRLFPPSISVGRPFFSSPRSTIITSARSVLLHHPRPIAYLLSAEPRASVLPSTARSCGKSDPAYPAFLPLDSSPASLFPCFAPSITPW